MDLKKIYLGGMVGSALGDAIGEIAFFHTKKESLLSVLGSSSKFRYTDDTAMAIGLAESIIREGKIDQQQVGERFRVNYQREPWRGYASGPPAIFSLVKRYGITYTDAARKLFGGTGSLGNGAAMRIGPVGLFFHGMPDLYEQATASAGVTHAHPVGMDGAAVQAMAVAQAVQLDPGKGFSWEKFIKTLIDFSRTTEIRNRMKRIQRLTAERIPPDKAVEELGRTVAVHESMPFAIYSFLNCPDSFEECLLCAILNGGDRDTLGAMACAISGAYLGIDAIPRSWSRKLENRAYIEELALALAG